MPATTQSAAPDTAKVLEAVASIDITAAGPSCRMWIGDVNGDGRMDLVLVQPDNDPSDTRRPNSVVAITAFELTGKQLWQIGTPDMANRVGSGADIPAQLYDIDADGQIEVLACINEELRIFDGKTGQQEAAHKLPDPDAHDCILFANFSGNPTAQDIVLKDRYRRLWAFDKDFKPLFTFSGNLGHYLWPYDFDGDGRDELIAGYHLLGSDGKEKWKMDLKGHQDAVWVADVDADPSNGMEIIVGGNGTYLYNAQGKQLWAYNGTVESQNAFPGDFRPDLPGLEIGGLDRINRNPTTGLDGLFLIDANGKELYKEKRQVHGWSSITTVVRNFDGKGGDHFLAYRRGGGLKPGLYDGHMDRVLGLPIEGHFMWADLLDNGSTQIVGYNEEGKAYIYSMVPFDLSAAPSGKPIKQPKRLYNWTRYWGSETPAATKASK
ncbi:MAG: hypothetical protein H7144_03225 [Burkholderiales bacterium]|nr:hypothetical protein [Phycisphaerae bacterium]